MKCKRVSALFAAVIFLFAFSIASFAQERSWPEAVDQYIAKVKPSVTIIDMEAFKKVVDNKGDAVILDVREPDEFKSGYVPGAINLPRGVAEFKIWKLIAGYPAKMETNKKIYIYCALGGRSVLTAKALKDIGFTDVTAVNMKIADWIKAGYPVER